MTTHYHSSTGQKVIADMNPHNLAAAHAKLLRDCKPGERQDEIDAMGARLAELAEFEAEQAVTA